MKQITLLTVFAVAAFAQSPARTQHPLDQGSMIMDSGVSVDYRTVIEPALQDSALRPLGSGTGCAGDTLRNFIYDSTSKTYFGYDMVVRPVAGTRTMQIRIGPLTASKILALKAVAGDLPLNPAPQPKFPPAQTVREGDTLRIELMRSADGRESIVNYLRFSTASDPRDFSIDDDVPLNFSLDPPGAALDLQVNGQKALEPVASVASPGGSTLWVYVPGYGRYILSLAPHEGFVKAGTLRGETIAFAADGHTYQVQVRSQISANIFHSWTSTWNLYLLRDPSYAPAGNLSGSIVAGISRLENLLPKP